MSLHKASLIALSVCAVALFAAPSHAAQGKGTPLKNYPVWEVGARPMGMGGAFIALADDVSATYWNPAGLAYIQRAELTIQGAFLDYEYERIDSGTFAPAGLGSPQNPTPAIDNASFKTYSEDNLGPSLIGFVYPNRFLSVGFSAARIVDYTESWSSQNVATSYGINMRPLNVYGRVRATNFNLSLSRFILNNLTVGANIKYTFYEFQMRGAQFASATTLEWDHESTGGGIAFDLGVIWTPIETLSLAAVFKYGEQVNYDEIFWNSLDTPVHDELKAFPHKLGIGATYFIFDNFTASVDAYYVMTSSLADHVKLPAYPEGNERFTIDDGMEIRAGLEYIQYVGEQHSLSFRLGGYIEPSYAITYERGPSLEPSDVANEDQLELLFPEVDDETHFTAGFGYALLEIGNSTQSLGFDVAANFGDTTSQYILSLFWRFGDF